MQRAAPTVWNRHLVRRLDQGRLKELFLVAGLAAVLLLPLLAYVWNHMEWIRAGYELERLKRERVQLAELGERLRIERASLASLARVEREARDRIGLVPAAGAVVDLPEPRPAALALASPPPPPASIGPAPADAPGSGTPSPPVGPR
jgi:cell division protein FtsL